MRFVGGGLVDLPFAGLLGEGLQVDELVDDLPARGRRAVLLRERADEFLELAVKFEAVLGAEDDRVADQRLYEAKAAGKTNTRATPAAETTSR